VAHALLRLLVPTAPAVAVLSPTMAAAIAVPFVAAANAPAAGARSRGPPPRVALPAGRHQRGAAAAATGAEGSGRPKALGPEEGRRHGAVSRGAADVRRRGQREVELYQLVGTPAARAQQQTRLGEGDVARQEAGK
jgi:hypothetical protein